MTTSDRPSAPAVDPRTDPDGALAVVDAFCDLVPRATADAEEHGPLTLFVARTGWPFHARPRLPRTGADPTADDVRDVLARQVELDVPRSFEWVHETAPALLPAVEEAGLAVERRPLLVLAGLREVPAPAGVELRVLGADDPDLDGARAAVSAGFSDSDEVDDGPASPTVRERAREGLLRNAGAFVDGRPVAGASAVPRDGVVELVGIATVPSYRGRGIGTALTALLAAQALAAGAGTVWLSATDDAVARVYERVGFVRVGTTLEATPR